MGIVRDFHVGLMLSEIGMNIGLCIKFATALVGVSTDGGES